MLPSIDAAVAVLDGGVSSDRLIRIGLASIPRTAGFSPASGPTLALCDVCYSIYGMDAKLTAALIARLRDHLHLSQEQLAARLNVSFATINRWEQGKSKPQRAQREAIDALSAGTGFFML